MYNLSKLLNEVSIMNINNKLMKQIDETRYLTAENAWRYRTIMRFFFHQYEKMKYWLNKEEIYSELKNHTEFNDYSIDQLKQELDTLISWKNLEAIQNTAKVSTAEEFKNKQFRYQMSEFSVEIERLTLRLENLHIENSSLEPSLLERIQSELKKLPNMVDIHLKDVGMWWGDLNNDFKRLNQNSQDYLRELYSVRAEELMKTDGFLLYKDRLINYLRDFIKGLQHHSASIENIINNLQNEDIKIILNKVFEYEKSIPRLEFENIDVDIYENINGRWDNIKKWFTGNESESTRLLNLTNEIIRKITRYASLIIESRNSYANRKEEYKKLAELFMKSKTIEDAHLLSSLTFGIFNMKHIKGEVIRETESINSSIWEEEPYLYTIKPRTRYYREKSYRTPINNNIERKKAMFEMIINIRKEEKKIINQYINGCVIDFAELPQITSSVRITLLKWLSLALISSDHIGKTEDGQVYIVIKLNDRCILKSEDGILEMPHYMISFVR
ncbi:MAG: hypothetical protein K0Q49_1963 [Haloplasmataceae bacterium]|jgi:uncharacterized protein (TIGR02677 family)|nr:hypothetical protein [Haloplasmataceae bacterium]